MDDPVQRTQHHRGFAQAERLQQLFLHTMTQNRWHVHTNHRSRDRSLVANLQRLDDAQYADKPLCYRPEYAMHGALIVQGHLDPAQQWLLPYQFPIFPPSMLESPFLSPLTTFAEWRFRSEIKQSA